MQQTNPHRVDDPVLPEIAQANFFAATLARTLAVEEVAIPMSVSLSIADTTVRLIFAGPAIATLFLPALEHLRTIDQPTHDLTLHLWDSASTGISMIDPPVTSDCFTHRGDIWGMNSVRYRSAFHWGECSLNLLDVEQREGVFWIPTTAQLPFWCIASPLRTLFHWWLESQGGQLLHGAAVGDESGAMLILGKGGVGKSTTALASLLCGLQYIGDDYLAVRLDPEPRVFSLYSTAKLDRAQMDQFPELLPLVSNTGLNANEKAVVQLMPEFASQVVRSLPLKALAIPAFADAASSTFAPVNQVALQRAATFTTMSQLPQAGAYLHAFMQRLSTAVPGFQLQLGRDVRAIPTAIRAHLADTNVPTDAMKRSASAMRDRPLVSVIVPVYNGAHFLVDAVRSILAQEYAPLEIIIVDDGSTDEIVQAVSALPVDVRFIRQANAGAAAARNRGITDASGELIAFLDVDDLWPESNLDRLVQLLVSTSSADVVHGRAQVLRRDANANDEYVGDPSAVFPHYIGAGVYRRAVFTRVGLFDPSLRFGEDADWFRRAAEEHSEIMHLDEVSLFVRRHDANMTRGKTQLELNALRVLKLAIDRKRAAKTRTLDAVLQK